VCEVNMSEKEEKKEEKHRCSKCGSLFGYFRIKDGAWQCRTCKYLDKEVIV